MDNKALYPRFSHEEFSRRYQAVRAVMAEADLAALVLYGTPGSDSEVQYLSNFPVAREAVLVFPLEGEPALFVQYFNHVPTARKIALLSDVRWGGPETMASVAEVLRETLQAELALGLGRCRQFLWNSYRSAQ